jgi:hypothetical protein
MVFGFIIIENSGQVNNYNDNYNPYNDNNFYANDNYIPPSLQNEFDDLELKEALEFSLIEMVDSLTSKMPKEPEEADQNSITLKIKLGADTFQRRFNKQDTVQDVKNYVIIKVRTFNEIEISEGFPKKVYSEACQTLELAGISNNSVLIARVL